MRMHWLIRRIIASLAVLLVALVINFAIPRLMPGSPIEFFAGGTKITDQMHDAIIKRFGLDKPLLEQFWLYIVNALKGDLGYSFSYYPQKVTDLIMNALPWTLLTNVIALVFEVLLGYRLGVIAAWKAGKKTDSIIQTVSLGLKSTPLFWIAMLIIYVFAYITGWFPFGGAYTAGAEYANIFERIWDIARHAFLPIITMIIAQHGMFQIILRNTMVNVLNEQYMMVAEAKGLSERRIKYKHAARNALLPMTTFVGLCFASTISGSIFIETVFAYPGVGRLVYQSAFSRDYPVLQGAFLIFSLFIVAVNFGVDIVYRYLDPRIRY
jgi:peptide/nickel transport system permease protein